MTGGKPKTGRWPSRWTERAGEWLSDEALSGLLLFLGIDLFVLPVVGPSLGDAVANAVFTVLLLSGLATVAHRAAVVASIGALVAAALVLRWTASVSDLPVVPVVSVGAAIVVFALFTLLVLLRTLSPGPINRHRIEGAIATYLLIGITFALAFELVERVQPGSLQIGEGAPETLRDAVGYFSLVTITTVGYGDVTPVTPLARRLAALEGLIGQLYPAIIIGWMVGSMRRRGD